MNQLMPDSIFQSILQIRTAKKIEDNFNYFCKNRNDKNFEISLSVLGKWDKKRF